MAGMQKEEPIIQVDGLTKYFGSTMVLNEVNIELMPGNIYGLIGRNGSGKTMLMKCICGFVAPTKGTVCVAGKIIGKDTEFAEDIGFIIENPCFLPQYSAYKNLAYLYSVKKKVDKEIIKHYIKLVGLDPEDKKKVGKYSMGMRQRLGIAQAIMEEHSILILDEPMNGLDNQGVEEMRNLFLELKRQGKTILLASHNREDIAILCDQVYEMDHGVCVKE